MGKDCKIKFKKKTTPRIFSIGSEIVKFLYGLRESCSGDVIWNDISAVVVACECILEC